MRTIGGQPIFIPKTRHKLHSCKIGTIPSLVIFRCNYKLVVGKKIFVRDYKRGSKWFPIWITRINDDGYFFADL